ncbi:MAG: ABC transporter permease [Deltaproteobacteria bacterium]|nr:ABC transporter permease [Deltaproteobacteria bacterium]MBW2150993.1 ABC transporter permease [Deltaproteobacteria bacterium]
MVRYVVRKLIILSLLLFLVSIIVFSVLFVLPGDPAQIILGINATPQTLENLRSALGLNQPLIDQYLKWIGNLLSGENRSINYDIPVNELLVSRLKVTGPLAVMAMCFAILLSLPAGVYAAQHRNRPADITVMFFTQIGLATPDFWLGMLLILLMAVKLGMFSAGGFPGWSVSFWGSVKALLLPAFCLGVTRASILSRLTRSSMLEVLNEDYIKTARAKGMKERGVIYKHALGNAMIPVVTIMGLQLGQLIAGAIIIENVFFLPGLGRLVFQAIGQRDLPVVRDIVLFMAAAIVFINFLVDLSYAYLDPRIRHG